MGTVHELKCWPESFDLIRDGKKTFEIRVNDRNYRTEDILRLNRYMPKDKYYTGEQIVVEVTSITQGKWGLPENLCVMSIRVMWTRENVHS